METETIRTTRVGWIIFVGFLFIFLGAILGTGIYLVYHQYTFVCPTITPQFTDQELDQIHNLLISQ